MRKSVYSLWLHDGNVIGYSVRCTAQCQVMLACQIVKYSWFYDMDTRLLMHVVSCSRIFVVSTRDLRRIHEKLVFMVGMKWTVYRLGTGLSLSMNYYTKYTVIFGSSLWPLFVQKCEVIRRLFHLRTHKV